MQTSLSIEGANCPTCFNETIAELNQLEGVQSVHGSFAGPCIEVEHIEEALDLITNTVRIRLHGTALYSDEVQMVSLEPTILTCACEHSHNIESDANIITSSMKLGDIVTQNPSLAKEFEKRGLDYCCQGTRTLAEAARKAGIDPEDLAYELTEAMVDEAPAPWSTLSPADLVDNIESVHHQYLWDNFDRTEALVEKVANVHGERHPELLEVKRLYKEIRTDLEPHLEKEEQVLFPMVRQISQTQTQTQAETEDLMARIKMFSHEHLVVGELLAELNRVTDGYCSPADGCATYAACYQALADLEADTHLHIHKEGNILFPAITG